MPVAIGQLSITHLRDGSTSEDQYAANTFLTVAPSGGWSSAVPSPQSGSYVWKRSRAVHADGTYGPWSNAVRITGAIGEPGVPGEAGPAGPAGPAGNPGQLGIYADGTTLHVKGYAEDGTLTASQGYIYIGTTRTTVPAYSEALTNYGIGYIAFDGSAVSFVKMLPDTESITWVDYNEPATPADEPYLILGRFNKVDVTITELELIHPIAATTFTRNHFMEILAREGWEEVNTWGQALGVSQFFQSLATWELFANNIKANHIEISQEVSGALFQMVMKQGEGGSAPVIQALRGGEPIFEINATDGSVRMNGVGDFRGKIDHEALETIEYRGGTNNSVVISNTKDLWFTTKLYNDLTSIAVNAIPVAASGTYGTKTISGIARLSSSTRLAWATYTQYESISTLSGPQYIGGITVQAGCATAEFSGYCGGTSFGPSGFYITKTPAGGGTPTNVFQYTGGRANKTWTGSVVPGDVLSCYIYGGKEQYVQDPTTWPGYAGPFTLKAFAAEVGPGVMFSYTDGTYGKIAQGQYRDDVLTLTSPAWSSASNLQYKKGNALFNDSVMSGLTEGTVYNASGTLTYDAMGTASENLTVSSVQRNASSVTLYTNNGPKIIAVWPTQGSATGVYDGYATDFIIVEQMRSILASSVLPKTEGDGSQDFHMVGSPSSPFAEGNFITVNATTVYGARFN